MQIIKRNKSMAQNSKTYATTYLIDEEMLKTYSQMTRNTGVDKIIPYLLLAQDYYLENILGVPLMVELKTQVSTNTLTEENKALIVKIAPCLSAWTDFLAARSLAYTVTQKGLTAEASENSRSLNEKELGYYIDQLRETANMAQEMLIKFLCRCRDQYVLWRPDNECDCSKYTDESTGTADPKDRYLIYFPNGKRSKCNECDYSNNIERI